MQIESRLPDIGTTIFTVMSRLAQEHDAINLSQGFPDFPIDSKLIDYVAVAMKEGFNQYAPMAGDSDLRNAIAAIISDTYGRQADGETEVTITAGATQAIFSAIAAFIKPGDEVIVFDPSYDSYNPAIRLNGGVPVHLKLNYPEFNIDWEVVRGAVNERTRMIIINSPHNPLGTVLSESDLHELESIVIRNDLIVVSDEVYERLVFDGLRHESVLRYSALALHSIACFSFGKTLHATGWKVGYTVAPAHLTTEIRKAHQFIVFSVNTPVQKALASYLSDGSPLEDLAPFYQSKRDQFLAGIKGSSFRPLKTSGSYFQILSYEGVSRIGDKEMAERLTKEFKVASIPVSVFYQDRTDNQLLRFCFAKKEETLEKATRILRNI